MEKKKIADRIYELFIDIIMLFPVWFIYIILISFLIKN